MQYTKYGYRINTIKLEEGRNWLFFPGGPGLGSEYLYTFTEALKLPGSKYLVDFPMDGSNNQGKLELTSWREGIIDLSKKFKDPIFVTHSFSGMFALTLPQLEKNLKGLVLMNTTSNTSFLEHTKKMEKKYGLPDLAPPLEEYHKNPSKQGYKRFWETYIHYCFTKAEFKEGEKMLRIFSFNNESYNYMIKNFYGDFKVNWTPNIPTLIIASEKDYICPPDAFTNNINFKSKYILHESIANAGHCPWVNGMKKVQKCFNEYVSFIETLK